MVLETADEPRITATARVMGTLGTDGFLSLNRFRLTDGRMPERADECVVQTTAGRYTEKALHIGDVLEISRENTDYGALCGKVTATKLTVVGICESPMSISVVAEPTAVGSGSITHMVYTPAALFTGDTYTDLFLTLEGAAALDAFGDAYKALVAEFADRYTPFASPETEWSRVNAARTKREGDDRSPGRPSAPCLPPCRSRSPQRAARQKHLPAPHSRVPPHWRGIWTGLPMPCRHGWTHPAVRCRSRPP